MKTFNITPIPPLKSIIKNIWIVDYSNSNRLERMIPFGCMDLVYVERNSISYRDKDNGIIQFSKGQIFLTGQITKPYHFEYQSNTKIIGFGFYPHTAHLFTRVSSHRLSDNFCKLSDFKSSTKLLEKLEEQNNMESKITILQNFIFNEIQKNKSNDSKQEYLRYLLMQIFNRKGHLDIDEVQKNLKISQRYTQILFKEYVGISPVLYAKIVRFLNAIDNYHDENKCLTSLALNLGYYDQSHFIRDFRRFTGLAPKQYFKEPPLLLEQFTKSKSSSLLYNSITEL